MVELEHAGPGKWVTTDGAFGVVKWFRPYSDKQRDQYMFSIRDLRERKDFGLYYEFSPEIKIVRRFKDVVPWLRDFVEKEQEDEVGGDI